MRVIWLLKRSAWVSLCVFCAGLVLLAVVMSLARVALSRPQLLTPWAERVVEAAVDEPVVFESVRGRLDGFSPALALRGVRIGRGDRELGLDRLRLRLDSLASLWRGTAVLASLEVSGARVRVTRHAQGDVRVQGRRKSILSRLPLPQRVRFTDIDVDWRDKTSADTPPLQLRSIALRGLRDGRHLRLAGTSELAAGGGAVELVARLATTPQSSDPFAGRIHVALEQVAAARLGKLVPRLAQQGAPVGGRLSSLGTISESNPFFSRPPIFLEESARICRYMCSEWLPPADCDSGCAASRRSCPPWCGSPAGEPPCGEGSSTRRDASAASPAVVATVDNCTFPGPLRIAAAIAAEASRSMDLTWSVSGA